MSDTLRHMYGTTVFVCASEGATLRGERDALDIIGEASYLGADWVVVPAGRFDDDFFRLRTRVAGEIVQKFVNYRMGIAVLGDISRHTAASSALRDFVREANRGTQVWFTPDIDDFQHRLEEAAVARR
ncbi:hypothetical protein FHS43_006832 [Streptosporangium becharense]|uniref:DUF4180 domain-containing protein n=1 Tax=Streptosporangium becharense TaxID=1816182 RepID=A0A7W9IIQ2_9ACTN|nr:DUF4180 domain-containing protein [Streptosporangium becharense]MBB2915511.1 hypothetical protein [Streptosporangium becharense]MBB5821016.1 hypothetical protein [Streptosporangium becharense]